MKIVETNGIDHSLLPSVRSATLPEKYQAAKLAISQCDKVDECMSWADKSKALASYARQSEDKEMENAAFRIRARAVRRCGELLGQLEKGKAGRPSDEMRDRTIPDLSPRGKAARDAKMSPTDVKTALRVANVPGDLFERQVESSKPPTITKLAEQGKGIPKGKPLYERLGMTREAFQAGMYFRGAMDDYISATATYKAADVVKGSTPDERKTIRRNLKLIEKYHKALKSKL